MTQLNVSSYDAVTATLDMSYVGAYDGGVALNPPTLTTPIPDQTATEGDSLSLDLSEYFTGADSYSVVGLPAGTGLSITGPILSGTLTSEDQAASPISATVTATNTDGDVSDGFALTVEDLVLPTVPQSLVDIGTIQTELDSAAIPYSYPGDDATSIEYSFNYGAWQAAASSPIELSTLTEDTSYNIRFAPVNAQGSGDMSQKGFRTKAQAPDPGSDDWPFSKGIRWAAPKTWTFGKRHPKTGMRVRIYK